jgi:hypothetical protein
VASEVAAVPEPTLDPAVPIADQVAAEPGERPILQAIAVADASMRTRAAEELAGVAAQLPVDAVLDILLGGPVTDQQIGDALSLAEGYAVDVALPVIDDLSRHAESEGARVAKAVRA